MTAVEIRVARTALRAVLAAWSVVAHELNLADAPEEIATAVANVHSAIDVLDRALARAARKAAGQ
jgi:hypothetical protein